MHEGSTPHAPAWKGPSFNANGRPAFALFDGNWKQLTYVSERVAPTPVCGQLAAVWLPVLSTTGEVETNLMMHVEHGVAVSALDGSESPAPLRASTVT